MAELGQEMDYHVIWYAWTLDRIQVTFEMSETHGTHSINPIRTTT